MFKYQNRFVERNESEKTNISYVLIGRTVSRADLKPFQDKQTESCGQGVNVVFS